MRPRRKLFKGAVKPNGCIHIAGISGSGEGAMYGSPVLPAVNTENVCTWGQPVERLPLFCFYCPSVGVVQAPGALMT